jgi:hypothetical protein
VTTAEQKAAVLDRLSRSGGDKARRPPTPPPAPASEPSDPILATLAEILRTFTVKGHPGEPCLRSRWIPTATITRWQAVLTAAQARRSKP